MKLYCLSGNPSQPCFVLKFKSTTIMLDCGLDMSGLMNFLPIPLMPAGKFSKLPDWSSRDNPYAAKLDGELKDSNGRVFVDSEPEFGIPELGMIDMSDVDVILLSNYHSMLALPFITEYTNFRGVVYATDPTKQMGRQFMEELVTYIESIPKPKRAMKWKEKNILSYLPQPLSSAVNPKSWRQCYNKHDIQACLSKVNTIGFAEKFDIFGSLELMATSSGYRLGSSNWLLQSDHEKIVYMSASTTLTTHPRGFDQKPLKDSDLLILSGLSQVPSSDPDVMIGEFCVAVVATVRNGGNVLIPCYPSGVIYDLLEMLANYMDSLTLSNIPFYFISPVADSSLAYSNIYSEWLCPNKQSKTYIPEHPFPHTELVRTGRLKHYSSIHDGFTQDLRRPCVVFTGHPSLRFGNSVHLMELWGKSSANCIIFTEPDFPYLDALAPYQPCAIKVHYWPIDTSLRFQQCNKIITELKPQHMVMSEQYTVPHPLLPSYTEYVVDAVRNPITFNRGSVLNIPIKRVYERIDIDPEVAALIVPKEVRPDIAVAMLSGSLVNDDNKYTLRPLSKKRPAKNSAASKPEEEVPEAPDAKRPMYVYGSLDTSKFIALLKQSGYTDVTLTETDNGHIVHLNTEDALIQIEPTSTHIIIGANESLRCVLRDALLKCLGGTL